MGQMETLLNVLACQTSCKFLGICNNVEKCKPNDKNLF